MQNILCRDGFLADAAFGKGQIFRNRTVEMVAHHQHIEMFVQRVLGEGAGGVGAGGQHIVQARHRDNIRRMAAARPFGVEGMNGAALEGADGVLNKAGFVQCVGMDHHLNVMVIRHREAVVDRGRGGAPVLMQFQSAGPRLDLLDKTGGQRGIALAGKADIHGKIIRRLDHAGNMPGAGGAGGGKGAGGRAGAAAQHRSHARIERLVNLLRADKMNMRVKAARGDDLALTGDHFGAGADDDGDAGLNIRIAGLANGDNMAVLQANIGLHNAPVVNDRGIGDDSIDSTIGPRHLRLAHAITDDLAAAEFHLFAIEGEILFNFDEQLGVREANTIAQCGAKHIGISGAGERGGTKRAHAFASSSLPITSPRKP